MSGSRTHRLNIESERGRMQRTEGKEVRRKQEAREGWRKEKVSDFFCLVHT